MKRRLLAFLLSAVIMIVCMPAGIGASAAAVKPAKVELGVHIVTPDVVTIKWKAAAGAQSYQLFYKKTTDSSYKYMGTTGTSATITGLAKKARYRFLLRGKNGSNYGETTIFELNNYDPEAVPKTWYFSAADSTLLRCDEVTSTKLAGNSYAASGYQFAKKSAGAYKLLKSLKDTTFNVSGYVSPHVAQTFGIRYYVTVRDGAVTANYFSKYYDVAVTSAPDPVNGFYADASTNNIKLTWDPPYCGADGYRIYIRQKDDSGKWDNWHAYRTVSGSVTTYTVGGLEKGTEYSFKVAPYSINKYFLGVANKAKERQICEGYYTDALNVRTRYSFDGYDGLILVGDSRVEYMSQVEGITDQYPDTTFIGSIGSGYSWLNTGAMTYGSENSGGLASYLNSSKNYIVVFNHGVNDLENADSYIKFYNDLIAKYGSKHALYFMSVNPVMEGSKYSRYRDFENGTAEEEIKSFNRSMKSTFGSSNYIDSYSFIEGLGYDTDDGIHYDSETYKAIMGYMLDELNGSIN